MRWGEAGRFEWIIQIPLRAFSMVGLALCLFATPFGLWPMLRAGACLMLCPALILAPLELARSFWLLARAASRERARELDALAQQRQLRQDCAASKAPSRGARRL